MTYRHLSLSKAIALAATLAIAFLTRYAGAQTAARQQQADWPIYGGTSANNRYSPLKQINARNVATLRVAWTFDTHEPSGLQTNPLIVGRTLYTYTPTQKVIALDAATGRLLWTFDSGIKGTQPARGLTWWQGANESRLFAGVMNYLYALDPANGKPVSSFGEGGRVDLRKQLRGDYQVQSIALTTPGVIYKDLIILCGRDPETHPRPAWRHSRLRCAFWRHTLDLPYHSPPR